MNGWMSRSDFTADSLLTRRQPILTVDFVIIWSSKFESTKKERRGKMVIGGNGRQICVFNQVSNRSGWLLTRSKKQKCPARASSMWQLKAPVSVLNVLFSFDIILYGSFRLWSMEVAPTVLIFALKFELKQSQIMLILSLLSQKVRLNREDKVQLVFVIQR